VLGIARSRRGRSLAYPVIDLAPDGGVEAIREYTGGEQLAGFVDSVGGPVLASLLAVLRAGATIASHGVLDDGLIPARNSDDLPEPHVEGLGIDHWLATRSQRRDPMTAELWALLREGALELHRRRRLRTG
jgi:NADPH:quinone reductase-like Zn-dependent oxidoreductase